MQREVKEQPLAAGKASLARALGQLPARPAAVAPVCLKQRAEDSGPTVERQQQREAERPKASFAGTAQQTSEHSQPTEAPARRAGM
jgi:hypothetical protein